MKTVEEALQLLQLECKMSIDKNCSLIKESNEKKKSYRLEVDEHTLFLLIEREEEEIWEIGFVSWGLYKELSCRVELEPLLKIPQKQLKALSIGFYRELFYPMRESDCLVVLNILRECMIRERWGGEGAWND